MLNKVFKTDADRAILLIRLMVGAVFPLIDGV